MDIKVVGMTPPDKTDMEKIQEENERSLPQQILDGAEPGIIENIAVKQVLEIERNNTDYDDDVKTLVKWAKEQTGSDDPQELKWAIRDLRMRLGTPNLGDAIKHLTRFAYLDLEEKRIKKEKQGFI
jgi:hypothetical protein